MLAHGEPGASTAQAGPGLALRRELNRQLTLAHNVFILLKPEGEDRDRAQMPDLTRVRPHAEEMLSRDSLAVVAVAPIEWLSYGLIFSRQKFKSAPASKIR